MQKKFVSLFCVKLSAHAPHPCKQRVGFVGFCEKETSRCQAHETLSCLFTQSIRHLGWSSVRIVLLLCLEASGLLCHLVHTCSNTAINWHKRRSINYVIRPEWCWSPSLSGPFHIDPPCGAILKPAVVLGHITVSQGRDFSFLCSEVCGLRGFVREEGRIKCSRWHCDSGSDCWDQHIVSVIEDRLSPLHCKR